MKLRASVLGLVCLAAACREGSSSSNPENLKLAVNLVLGTGELQALRVPEEGQAGTDLNGDGDLFDEVLHVFDFATGRSTSLGLDCTAFAVGGNLVAFGVQEEGQGATDLNGNGSTFDVVLHVYDSSTGLTTNTGLLLSSPLSIGISSVAFLVFEAGQGDGDLNADGDVLDLVLHVYDARTQLTRNTERAATAHPAFHDHAFGFTSDEPSSAADLNGDGDSSDDFAFELYDLLLGGVEQTPFALLPTTFLAANVDDWLVLVDEAAQGLDLNGDGDELDGVWHQVDPHGPGTIALGYSNSSAFGSISDGEVLGLIAMELDGRDANGDGDLLDRYAVLHDPLHDQTFSSDRALGSLPLALAGGHLAFAVDEAEEGADLNGDLDLLDEVLHTLEVANGNVVNHARAVAGLQGVGSALILWLDESEDGLDRNDDGDTLDRVLTKLDPETLLEENLGLASAFPLLAVTGTRALAVVPEAEQGRDLNGDGDLLDEVAYRFEAVFPVDPPLADLTRFPLAIERNAALLSDGRGLLVVSEAGEGRDLNGDGDPLDTVLHRFE
jgi:hypothetical protein